MRSATKNKTGKDPAYLEWIRSLPCAVKHWMAYWTLYGFVEAAHVGDRGLSQKCSDRETIPLCRWHHREGPHAHHKLGKRFWKFHGLDRDALIAELNLRYEEERNAVAVR